MKMILSSLIFFFLFLSSTSPYQNSKPIFHIWNIGQGQWATYVDDQICEHYDMGGEFAPWGQILRNCERRKNIVYISHWDWDHLGFAERFQRKVRQVCLVSLPDGPATERKKRILEKFPICPYEIKTSAKIFYRGSSKKTSTNNDRSDVLISQNFLITGDSSLKEERQWIPLFSQVRNQIRNLVIGHHGSRTSTSDELLQKLPKLQHAIASSRRKKYGHPHQEVVAKLRRFHIPLLLTEEWGNLHFE